MVTIKRVAHYAALFKALLHRELVLIKSQVANRLINAAILVGVQALVMRYFLPLMGLPIERVAPIYLVSVAQVLFFLGFNMALSMVIDLKSKRTVEYFLLLPGSIACFFAAQITAFLIEGCIIGIPMIIVGSILLGSAFDSAHVAWLSFFLIFFLFLIFCGLLFTTLGYAYPYSWFSDNIWPRRLSPLFFFSASFYHWYGVYQVWPACAWLFLLNPLTYGIEGLRGTLIGGDQYLSWPICAGALIIFCVLMVFILFHAFKKRLDPV